MMRSSVGENALSWGHTLAMLGFGLLVFAAGGTFAAQTGEVGASDQLACQDGGEAKFGAAAVVLRCGHLSNSDALEALVAVRLKSIHGHKGCIPVSQVAILQLVNGTWHTALEAEQQIKNPEGFIGLDYIDDSYQVRGYCLGITDRRPGSREPFSLALGYITKSGDFEGVPTYIGWNSKVGRYQEFAGGDDTAGFNPEVKSPRHINTAKQCCGKGK